MDSEKKITIFDILRLIDQKKFDAIEREEISKAFVPFLTNRWLTGTDDAAQIYIANEIANRYVFSLHKHKNLIWKLMCCTTSGTPQRYQYIKTQKSSASKDVIKLLAEYYNCSEKEAAKYAKQHSKEDLMEIATFLGRDKDEQTKLKKELD
jgi:hypothetical protein